MTTLATCILQNDISLKAETIIETGGHKKNSISEMLLHLILKERYNKW